MAGFNLVWKMATSPVVSEFNKYRKAHGLPGRLPIARTVRTHAAHVICPGVREIDLPLVVPDSLGLYGPIVLDTAPIGTAYPELNQWLDRGVTAVMCMGTHFHYTESQVKAIISGFLSGINHDSDTRLLWKLFDKSRFESLIEEALKDPRDKERFKIVDWFEADPASIMKHPNVIAHIHITKVPCEYIRWLPPPLFRPYLTCSFQYGITADHSGTVVRRSRQSGIQRSWHIW